MYSPMSPQTHLSSELKKIIDERNILSMQSRMKVLNTFNENDEKCVEKRDKILRSQVIQEILTTEVTYLGQLEILAKYYIQPILERNLSNHPLFITLLENIKTLYNVSGEIVTGLKDNLDNIFEIFHKLAPFFKLYSLYAYDYTQVLNLLQVCQDTDPEFKKFIHNQETRPEVNIKLSSLLITPVQRVPRYQLLVKQVLQHTSCSHKDYRPLQACLVEIEKSAKHINTLIAQNEEMQKLLNLQKCIVTSINLIKPGRILIKQGSLMRVSRRGNSAYKRYFVLLSDTLLYCKGEPGISLSVSCVLPLNKCTLTCVLNKRLFRVTCLHESFLLYSEKDDDGNEWIQAIHNAIKKYAECRQTLRKESSSRKPLRHNNVNEFSSENISRKCIKRKRCKQDTQIPLNSSDIMYFKKDNEKHTNVQQETACLPFCIKIKKFKKNKHHEASDIKLKTKNINSKLYRNRSKQNALAHKYIKKLNSDNNQSCTTDVLATKKEHGVSIRSILTSVGDQASPPLQTISRFLMYVGASIKDLFTFK